MSFLSDIYIPLNNVILYFQFIVVSLFTLKWIASWFSGCIHKAYMNTIIETTNIDTRAMAHGRTFDKLFSASTKMRLKITTKTAVKKWNVQIYVLCIKHWLQAQYYTFTYLEDKISRQYLFTIIQETRHIQALQTCCWNGSIFSTRNMTLGKKLSTLTYQWVVIIR